MKPLAGSPSRSPCCVMPAVGADLPSSAGNLNVETVARGLDQSVGARLPARRQDARHRASRPAAHRHARRQALAAGRRRAAGARLRSGRTARRRARPRLRVQQDDLFLLRRAGLGRRPHRDGARAPHDGEAPQLDDVKVIFRQEGPLSSGNHYGCRIVQGRDGNLWLTMGDHFTYRDEAQNLANHLGKIVRVTPDGAVPPTIRSSAATMRSRRSGATATATRRAPRCIRRPASSGARARPARRRRSQHSARRQELWLAGDRLRHRLFRREDPRGDREARHGAADQVLGAVDRAFRHGVLHRRPFPGAGRAACSSARSPGRCWCGSNSTARRSPRRSGCSTNLGERIRDVRQGPGRRDLAAHRRRQRACAAGDTGEVIELITRSHVTNPP